MRNSAGSKFSSATSFRPSLCQDQHHQLIHFYYDFCMAFNQALTIMASATFGLYCQSGRPRWECRPTFSWGCWQSCPWWSRASGWSPRAPPSCGAPSRQLEITLSVHKHKHNCPTVTQVCTQWTALVAVPPGLEPWQLLGRVVAAAVLQPAPSHWRAAHRRFNRHDPAPCWIFTSSSLYSLFWFSKSLLISARNFDKLQPSPWR